MADSSLTPHLRVLGSILAALRYHCIAVGQKVNDACSCTLILVNSSKLGQRSKNPIKNAHTSSTVGARAVKYVRQV